MKCVALRCQAPTFDPCLSFVFRNERQAVGASATHIDDILGCGEPDVLTKMRNFSGQRFGKLGLQEESFAHVGMELVWDSTFSAALTQGDSTKNLQPLGTSPQLWAARQKLLSPDDVKLRQCKLGELCWLATVSRPDICARLARITSRIDALQGRDVYRINELMKTAKGCQQATVLKYVSSSQLGQGNLAQRDVEMRRRGGIIRGNTLALVGWSDAAYGVQPSLGKCRLGYVIGLMLPNLCAPCHYIQSTSNLRANKS